MAIVEEVHVGDIGTVFEVTIKDNTSVVDISSATTMQIIFRKPDGSRLEKTATLTNSGVDGKMEYTSVSGDLDRHGSWKLQGRVVMSGGAWRSSVGNFDVYPNL